MSGVGTGELCENGNEVFEKAGVGAEWVGDAGGECLLFLRLWLSLVFAFLVRFWNVVFSPGESGLGFGS